MVSKLSQHHTGFLGGRLLVAMPSRGGVLFDRSVVYMCTHNEEGAMGFVLNHLMGSLALQDLLPENRHVSRSTSVEVHLGGPMESKRGFVLHSSDYKQDDTFVMEGGIALTATLDILQDMAEGHGPKNRFLALGYASWGPQQLEQEVSKDIWLVSDCDSAFLFDQDPLNKWDHAMKRLGIEFPCLTPSAGHA